MPNNKKITPPRLTFLARGDFQARSRFARSTIPEEKWGLLIVSTSGIPPLSCFHTPEA